MGWANILTYVAAALGTYAFPRAETVLKREGLDPEIAQQLAPGMRIYVREDNLLGKAHAMLDDGLLGIYLQAKNYVLNDGVGGYAIKGRIYDSSVCRIYLKRDRAFRPVNQEGYEGYIANPMQPQEAWRHTILHEIRHCGQNFSQMTGELTIEGDADYQAAEAQVRSTGDAGLRQRVLDNRALGMSHDTALYLDAKFRGVAPPSEEDIQRERRLLASMNTEANRQAKEQIAAYQKSNEGMCRPVIRLNYRIERPLTARRLALEFLAAQRVFEREERQEQVAKANSSASRPNQKPEKPLPLCTAVS